GVIGGESAGAMILASQITKNIPPGTEPDLDLVDGFGFLEDAIVVPHLFAKGFQESLVPVVAAHRELLGIGIDNGAAVVVRNGSLEAMGNSKVALYDNADHDGHKYYFLSPGECLDLPTRKQPKAE